MRVKLLILGVFLILILLVGVFAAVLITSAQKISADVSDINTTSHIDKNIVNLQPTYSGSVVVTFNLTIDNGGQISLKDIVIHLELYFQAEGTSDWLNVGNGDNVFGDVPPKQTISKILEINVTESIPVLAVTDGTIRVDYVVNLVASLIFSKSLEFTGSTTTDWTAPYKTV